MSPADRGASLRSLARQIALANFCPQNNILSPSIRAEVRNNKKRFDDKKTKNVSNHRAIAILRSDFGSRKKLRERICITTEKRAGRRGDEAVAPAGKLGSGFIIARASLRYRYKNTFFYYRTAAVG